MSGLSDGVEPLPSKATGSPGAAVTGAPLSATGAGRTWTGTLTRRPARHLVAGAEDVELGLVAARPAKGWAMTGASLSAPSPKRQR